MDQEAINAAQAHVLQAQQVVKASCQGAVARGSGVCHSARMSLAAAKAELRAARRGRPKARRKKHQM